MRVGVLLLAGAMLVPLAQADAGLFSKSSDSSSKCGAGKDVVVDARTDEVDLFKDAAGLQKAQTIEQDKFPTCLPITGRVANEMLQISMSGGSFWVPPHMVHYVWTGKMQPICRNLAMGTNTVKAGATRGLGEGCKGGH
ncbi:MAG TPA: hypothetical protein VGF56_03305 [Rhizomicrobium sp.]